MVKEAMKIIQGLSYHYMEKMRNKIRNSSSAAMPVPKDQ